MLDTTQRTRHLGSLAAVLLVACTGAPQTDAGGDEGALPSGGLSSDGVMSADAAGSDVTRTDTGDAEAGTDAGDATLPTTDRLVGFWDWSTALGTTPDALLDAQKNPPLSEWRTAENLPLFEVVPGPALGFP